MKNHFKVGDRVILNTPDYPNWDGQYATVKDLSAFPNYIYAEFKGCSKFPFLLSELKLPSDFINRTQATTLKLGSRVTVKKEALYENHPYLDNLQGTVVRIDRSMPWHYYVVMDHDINNIEGTPQSQGLEYRLFDESELTQLEI